MPMSTMDRSTRGRGDAPEAAGARSSDHGFRELRLHGCDEPIASFWEGLDVSGSVRGVVEGGADLLDAGVQADIVVHMRFVPPEPSLQLLPSDELPLVLSQHGEDLERLGREFKESSVLAELFTSKIHLERPKTKGRRFTVWHIGAASQFLLQPGHGNKCLLM